ncbi:MAG: SRPBCC family protein [Acidimicrobiales bacterium]
MELKHDFEVFVPIEEAWAVLTDLERIAPCMPGAQLLEVEGDEYRGLVKVKVGPITAQYRGTAKIVDLDPTSHRAVLRAEGRDARGQGTASATVIATLKESDGGTDVHIETDLDVSGKVAQFGRGVLAEVSEKILGQFVSELEVKVLSGGEPVTDDHASSSASDSSGVVTAAGEPAPRVIDSRPAAPVDLLDAAGGSMLKRMLPLAFGLVLLAVIRRWRRRR